MRTMDNEQIQLAEKTFLAILDPYGSVIKTYPLALRNAKGEEGTRYIGIKDRVQISEGLLRALQARGFYLHTLDAQSFGGRAVDINLKNPITGRFMTGSSSGTAVNVFIGINDLGIGTDGGGSVLAPAASLNLYAFMSPLICADELDTFPQGMSPDGISFRGSIGFMDRGLDTLLAAVGAVMDLPTPSPVALDPSSICIQPEALPFLGGAPCAGCDSPEFPLSAASRAEQLEFLRGALSNHAIVVSKEGPIDVEGMGDTVFGHFDERTAAVQAAAAKGLVKVVNMAGATALMVPVGELASGVCIITASEPTAIARGIAFARSLPPFSDELLDRYFRNLAKYVPVGYGEPDYRIERP